MAEENLVEGIEADDVYVGNGAAREFPITFTFSNESEVAVFLNGQVIRRGYKVEDGNVVFTIAPANGDVVSILKATAPEYVGGTEKEPEDNGYGNIYIQTDQDQLEVAQIASQVNYIGNGATTDFPTTFSFENSNEVVVYVNSRLVRSGYTVNNEAVVFDEAPANGDAITILKLDLSEYVEEDEREEEEKEEESSTVFDQASQEHIKINPVQTKVKYTGNGAVYEFPTIFAFFEDDNVVVYLNGVIINGGYSVTGVGETDGGLVIFDTPPAEGDKIVILRKVVVERVTDFQEGGSFRAKNINDELDRMTAFCQQIEEEMSRCVKVEVTDDQDPKELIDKVFDQLDLATEVGEAAIKTAEETAAMIEGLKDTVNAETEIAIERVNVAAEDNIEKSRIWAEGEQEEVEALGGELSSRGFADFAYAIANTPEDVPLYQSNLIALDIVKGPKGDKGDKGEDGKNGSSGEGIEIGDVGIAPLGIDESLNLRRYLNGQIIPLNQFVSFTEKLRKAIEIYPNLATTEENWQAEVTNSKLGQCGKFVVDTEAETIRLPKVVNINGLTDLALIGGIKEESLPNIKGNILGVNGRDTGSSGAYASGAFKYTSTRVDLWWANSSQNGAQGYDFNASRSSSTYQDGAPVKQEAIQYPYYIQVALGVEESVSTTREIQLNNPFFFGMSQYFESTPKNASWLISNGSFHSGAVYKSFYEWLLKIYSGAETIEGVSIKASTDRYSDYDYVINTADTTFRLPNRTKDDYVVDSYVNGTEWYKVYKSGYVKQGGKQTTSSSGNPSVVVNFHLQMSKIDSINAYPLENSGQYGNSYSSIGNVTNNSCVVFLNAISSGGNVSYSYTNNKNFIWMVTGQGVDTPASKTYFYVGETVQDANLIAASNVIAEVAEADYIVESKFPTESDPRWCRVYKSGWVEQGGSGKVKAAAETAVSFVKPFLDTSYTLISSGNYLENGGEVILQTTKNGATGFKVEAKHHNDDTFYERDYCWEAKGMGAK